MLTFFYAVSLDPNHLVGLKFSFSCYMFWLNTSIFQHVVHGNACLIFELLTPCIFSFFTRFFFFLMISFCFSYYILSRALTFIFVVCSSLNILLMRTKQ
jgi:hypothetical protein